MVAGHVRRDMIRNKIIREVVGYCWSNYGSFIYMVLNVSWRPIEVWMRMVDQMTDSSIIRDKEWLRKIMGQTIKKDLELNNLLLDMIHIRALWLILSLLTAPSFKIELGYHCKRFHWWMVHNSINGLDSILWGHARGIKWILFCTTW